MSSVPLWEIKRRLDDFGVSYAAIEGDRPALEQLLLEQYTYEEDASDAYREQVLLRADRTYLSRNHRVTTSRRV